MSVESSLIIHARKCERIRTQRAMIAALYWRVGECDVLVRLYGKVGNRGMVDIYLGNKLALHSAAKRMEAHL